MSSQSRNSLIFGSDNATSEQTIQHVLDTRSVSAKGRTRRPLIRSRQDGARERYALTVDRCRRGWLATLLIWIERSSQRWALREMASRNDYRLNDIGLSQDQARREAAKPFWRQ